MRPSVGSGSLSACGCPVMSPGPPLQAKLRSDLRGYAVFPSGAYGGVRPGGRSCGRRFLTGRCRAYGYSRMRSRLTKAGAAGHIGSTPRRWWGTVGVLYPWASTDPFPLSTMAACRSNQHPPRPYLDCVDGLGSAVALCATPPKVPAGAAAYATAVPRSYRPAPEPLPEWEGGGSSTTAWILDHPTGSARLTPRHVCCA